MAILADPTGRLLELRRFRYEFPSGVGSADDNWLSIELHAVDGNQEWTMASVTLLAHEVTDLAAWLGALADGEVDSRGSPDSQPEWLAFDQELRFTARATAGGRRLHARIYVNHVTPGGGPGHVEIEFEPDAESLRAFAEALLTEAEPFPNRW